MAGRDRKREREFVDFFAGEYWPLRRVGFFLTGSWHETDFSGDDQVLWQALRQLPTRQRSALVLRFYLDLPEAEVARLLGVPIGTVKSWVHRGLTRMRARLGPDFQTEPLHDTEIRP